MRFAVPADAFRIDGQGRFLLPGLADMHVHLTSATFANLRNDFLLWLAERLVELRSRREESREDRELTRRQAKITDELVDLVTYRLHRITDDEVAGMKGQK